MVFPVGSGSRFAKQYVGAIVLPLFHLLQQNFSCGISECFCSYKLKRKSLLELNMIFRLEDTEDNNTLTVFLKVQLGFAVVLVNSLLKCYNMEVSNIHIQMTCFNFFSWKAMCRNFRGDGFWVYRSILHPAGKR